MAPRPIPAHLIDFAAAMEVVGVAYQLLQHFDWQDLHRTLSDADGMLVFRDPTLFRQIQADPQWGMKVSLVRAAADFTHAVRSAMPNAAQRTEVQDG